MLFPSAVPRPTGVRYPHTMWWSTPDRPDIEAALARVPIFSDLGTQEVRSLAEMCHLKSYAAGEAILEEGSIGLGMFVLVSGRVEVFKHREDSENEGPEDDDKILLAVLEAGDVLGEMALLDDQPRSASAVALTATECLLLSRDRFRVLVESRPAIAWPIVPALAARIRDLQQRLLDAEGRPRSEADAALVADVSEPTPAPPESASNGDRDPIDPGVLLLRAPYALLMTGTDSLDESARLLEIFLRSFDEAAGLSRGRPVAEVVRDLPGSLVQASMASWNEGLQVPSRILGGFRRRLRPAAGDRG